MSKNFPVIQAHLKNLRNKTNEALNIEVSRLDIPVQYDLDSPRILGMFNVVKNRAFFRLNKRVIMAAGEKEYLDVVTHEFAHLVAYMAYTHDIKPHGKEWQAIMGILGAKEIAHKNTNFANVIKEAYTDKLKVIKCGCSDGVYTLGVRRANNILRSGDQCIDCKAQFKEVLFITTKGPTEA